MRKEEIEIIGNKEKVKLKHVKCRIWNRNWKIEQSWKEERRKLSK